MNYDLKIEDLQSIKELQEKYNKLEQELAAFKNQLVLSTPKYIFKGKVITKKYNFLNEKLVLSSLFYKKAIENAQDIIDIGEHIYHLSETRKYIIADKYPIYFSYKVQSIRDKGIENHLYDEKIYWRNFTIDNNSSFNFSTNNNVIINNKGYLVEKVEMLDNNIICYVDKVLEVIYPNGVEESKLYRKFKLRCLKLCDEYISTLNNKMDLLDKKYQETK